MALDPKLYFIHIFVYIDGAQVDGKMKIAGKSGGGVVKQKANVNAPPNWQHICQQPSPPAFFFLQSHAAYASKNKKKALQKEL